MQSVYLYGNEAEVPAMVEAMREIAAFARNRIAPPTRHRPPVTARWRPSWDALPQDVRAQLYSCALQGFTQAQCDEIAAAAVAEQPEEA
jgi:hypothetical protein